MRLVQCKKLGREAPGLDAPPLHGALGDEVFAHVSAEAWAEWLEMQLKIVNEYRLDLSEKAHRKTLVDQLRAFLNLDGAGAAALHVGTPTEKP